MAGLTVGELSVRLSFDKKSVSSGISEVEREVASGGSKISKGWAVAFGAIASITSQVFNKVTSVIGNSVNTAIKRVDTLNNSSRVFEALGYSSEAVSNSMNKLEGYLHGLPTSMTDAVNGVQSLSASFGSIEKGTEYFMAMNNAGLAFGATSDMISGAITQLGQLSLDGPLDAATWDSLRDSGFGPVFAAMANEAGVTVGELKNSFGGEGTKTVQDFLDQLIKLDQEGSGSMMSLNEVAKANTAGIGTALENVKNRAVDAISKIINEIGPENISNAINDFSASFGKVADVVVGAIKWIGDNSSWLAPLVIGLVTAFTALSVIMGVVNAVMAANPIVLIIAAVAGLVAGLVLLWNNCEGFRNFIMGAVEAIGNVIGAIGSFIGGVFEGIWNIAQPIINLIVGAFQMWWGVVSAIFGWVFESAKTVFDNIWQIISTVVGLISGAIKGVWDFLVGVFSPIVSFFGEIFGAAFDAIKNIFSGIVGFFKGIWDGIVNIFTSIGGVIGDAVGGAFKAVINTVIGFAENFLNTPIRAINAVIGVINVIPGMELGYLEELRLPRMAHGGIVPGNSYSGDNNLIRANSGEMVITRQQQAALWDAIEHGSFSESSDEVTNINNRPIQIINENHFYNNADFDTFNSMLQQQLRRAVV